MSMTREQLRAARILLHLDQEQLASDANMGIATLRRYEGGHKIGPLRLKALREAIERAGAVLISGASDVAGGATGVGVALLPTDRLPEVTRKRLADEADRFERDGAETGAGIVQRRGRGRPRKVREVSPPDD